MKVVRTNAFIRTSYFVLRTLYFLLFPFLLCYLVFPLVSCPLVLLHKINRLCCTAQQIKSTNLIHVIQYEFLDSYLNRSHNSVRKTKDFNEYTRDHKMPYSESHFGFDYYYLFCSNSEKCEFIKAHNLGNYQNYQQI